MQADLMTSAELAREWQIKPKTLDNWRYKRIGPPFVRIGGVVRYSRKAVAEWVAEQNEGGRAA